MLLGSVRSAMMKRAMRASSETVSVIPSNVTQWRMDHEEYGDEHEAAGDQRQRETLEPAEVSRC